LKEVDRVVDIVSSPGCDVVQNQEEHIERQINHFAVSLMVSEERRN
jgi:hypothetical protein